ncbi:histone-like nucleoid-structuring protein Lsr2 [Pseudonocardia spirodelae]|uniref:histone-like nucleoid-structuring protein Lsr2 n=1 Tax=Pseudonocardia spirodelae TaxID=3133431 RepID=UPI003BF54494
MAKVETIRLVDDITGGDADETVAFGLDGRRFEIDLSTANADALRDALAPFLGAARPAGTPKAGRAAAPAATGSGASGSDAATREHNREVRAWARENGWTLSERGRIPSEVVEAHRRAHEGPGDAAGVVTGDDPGADTGAAPVEEPVRQAPAVEFSG